MPTANHQTIRLSRGRHSGPEDGACVMELASMLAGEPFSDHPASASAVVGAFLRAYNDAVEDERRQTLYRYAAMVVGTRAADEIERARAHVCAAWIERIVADARRFGWWRCRVGLRRRGFDSQTPMGTARGAGELAAMLVRREGDGGETAVLGLLDLLIAVPSAPTPAASGGTRGSAGAGVGRSDRDRSAVSAVDQ